MKLLNPVGIFLVGLAAIALVNCRQPVSPSRASATVGNTQVAPAPSTLNHLDVSDLSAWNAAVSAGKVRLGSVLVKTGPAFSSSVLAGLGATETGRIDLPGGTWRHLTVPTGMERGVILALKKIQGVLAVEQENILKLPAGETRRPASSETGSVPRSMSSRSLGQDSSGNTTTVLNDPDVFSSEYNLTIADALDAYEAYAPPVNASVDSATSVSPYVAVLDTGINLEHQDLSSGTQSTFSACSMFTSSYDYVTDGSPPIAVPAGSNWDDDGHGSHVAGIIAALGDNALGTAGVMWRGANLILYKIFCDTAPGVSDSGSDWAIYGSLFWLTGRWNGENTNTANPAISHPYQTTLPVNMSIGGTTASFFESDMINYALQNNVVIIAAMGNDGQTLAEYPAAYSGVIAVGATEGNDTQAPFSTTGNWICVSAPGFDIISTYNGSSTDYEYDSGTSMATPFVTGLVAYMISRNPGLTLDQIKAILEDTADDVAKTRNTDWAYLGAGRVNVKHALDETLGQNGYTTPAAGSKFSTQPLTISVTLGGVAQSGIPVFLYDSNGNFVQAGLTSLETQEYSTSGTTGSVSGVISFWLLPPGTYTAKAVDATGSHSGSTPLVTVSGTSASVGTIALQ